MADFDPATFLEVVDELLTAPGDVTQARIRAAANRAYYSQYASLRQKIVTAHRDCFVVNGKSSGRHTKLYATCSQSGNPLIRRIGQRLKRLCLLRDKSDYTWDEAGQPKLTEVETARETAKKLQEKIGRLSNSDLKAIHTAVK